MHSKFQLNIQIRPAVTNIQYDRGAYLLEVDDSHQKAAVRSIKLSPLPRTHIFCSRFTFFLSAYIVHINK